LNEDGEMSEKQYNVLVLCTGNSARSILGEALFNALGKGKFIAHSAGSHPAGRVNPFALELLQQQGFSTEGLRSKSWDEFAAPGAPEIDFIFTVCDNAAGETCPIWPGKPATAHWGIPDPAAVTDDDAAKRAAFRKAAEQLAKRIQLFMSLPIESLDKLALKEKLAEIGRIRD
jgi:arsenate reductase